MRETKVIVAEADTETNIDIQQQLEDFTLRHMRKGLKEVMVKGHFDQFREVLLKCLPGSIDTIEMLALLEGAEVKALESVMNDVQDGL